MVPSTSSIRFARMLSFAEHISARQSPSQTGDPVTQSAERNIAENEEKTAESAALSSLQHLIGTRHHALDLVLASITDVARSLTGASGAALAMGKDGAMVCRARSGPAAPALGAPLDANAGISGNCLRTGRAQYCADTEEDSLVDREVCRRLGSRSIAISPIPGRQGTIGILAILSSRRGAFNQQHIALLQALAGLAGQARSARPGDTLRVARRG